MFLLQNALHFILLTMQENKTKMKNLKLNILTEQILKVMFSKK